MINWSVLDIFLELKSVALWLVLNWSVFEMFIEFDCNLNESLMSDNDDLLADTFRLLDCCWELEFD